MQFTSVSFLFFSCSSPSEGIALGVHSSHRSNRYTSSAASSSLNQCWCRPAASTGNCLCLQIHCTLLCPFLFIVSCSISLTLPPLSLSIPPWELTFLFSSGFRFLCIPPPPPSQICICVSVHASSSAFWQFYPFTFRICTILLSKCVVLKLSSQHFQFQSLLHFSKFALVTWSGFPPLVWAEIGWSVGRALTCSVGVGGINQPLETKWVRGWTSLIRVNRLIILEQHCVCATVLNSLGRSATNHYNATIKSPSGVSPQS